MKNYFKVAAINFITFLNNDDIEAPLNYGVAPPQRGATAKTDPRYSRPPYIQQTSAGHWDSDMGPDIQAGEVLDAERNKRYTDIQEYAAYIQGEPTDAALTGDTSPATPTGFYREDPRTPDVPKSGKRDFQADPGQADRNQFYPSAGFGHPNVPQTQDEGIWDRGNYPVDRDPGEVNTPEVFGNGRIYQGSQFKYNPIPDWLVGGSSIAPRESQFQSHRDLESEDSHKDQIWFQPTNRNAVSHTVGHDHPFDHEHQYVTPVDYSSSIGNVGTDRLVTKQ